MVLTLQDVYTPLPLEQDGFNRNAVMPCGCTCEHIAQAMNDCLGFLTNINGLLLQEDMQRFEALLMPANFSSIVGEFVKSRLPKYSTGIVNNRYHNGHPDLIPAGCYPNDSVQHGKDGIEVKASRYLRGWQGHNCEATWLLVFVFEGGRATDEEKGVAPIPFRFLKVVGAQLEQEDWTFAGRSETSRRTITASVNPSGYEKMEANWIYKVRELR